MKKIICIILLLLILKNCFAQNINVVIQVNEKLVDEGISRMYLSFDSGQLTKKIDVGYVPET
jgi:hypothetical protein